MTNKLPPKVGHILKLAEIIREVDGSNSLGAALREVINQLQQSPGVIMCPDVLELCEELEAL
jgi:hypothetical protein